jgi:hypothetical protein
METSMETYFNSHFAFNEFFHREAFCHICVKDFVDVASDRRGDIEPQLLKKILYYICSHNTHIQQLVINVNADSNLIMSSVSSCRALTFLNLHGYDKSCDGFKKKVIFKISEFLCTDKLGSS